MTLPNLDIVQVAYFVEDIRISAEAMSKTFGAGPFYIIDKIELKWGEHRGERCDFVHSSAYGQWGQVMMELVQQDSPGGSPFRDLYPPGKSGLHHVATMVDDLPTAYRHYEAAGMPLATRAMTLTGTEFAFLDATATLGHFIEVYERTDALMNFYAFIRNQAQAWDGAQPLREMPITR